MDTVIIVQDVMGAMEFVQVVIAVKFVLDVKVIIVEVVEVLIIVESAQIVKNAILVMKLAIHAMINVFQIIKPNLYIVFRFLLCNYHYYL